MVPLGGGSGVSGTIEALFFGERRVTVRVGIRSSRFLSQGTQHQYHME